VVFRPPDPEGSSAVLRGRDNEERARASSLKRIPVHLRVNWGLLGDMCHGLEAELSTGNNNDIAKRIN